MRNTLFLIVTLLISYHALAQYQKWEVYLGSPNKMDTPSSLIESYDRGLIIGSWEGEFEGTGVYFKTSRNGEELFHNKLFHSAADFDNWALAQDAEGNLYSTGPLFMSNNIDSWPFILKFNPCGEILWCRHFPDLNGTINGGSWDILITDRNEILVLTSYFSEIQLTTVIYLICVDSDGELLWKKQYASKDKYPLMSNPIGFKIIEHKSNYYISGQCYYPFPNNPYQVFLRPLFIGIDSNFDEKWVKPFYALDTILGWAETIIPLDDTLLMGAGIRRLEVQNGNSLLMFIDINGNESGYSQINNEQLGNNINANYICQIKQLDQDMFITASPYGTHSGVNPIGNFLLNREGTVFKHKSYPNTEKKPKMVKTFDNKYVIATNILQGTNWDIYLYKINADLESIPFDTTQYVYDSLCPYPIPSGTIDLTDCLVITSIDELPSPDEYYESIRWIPLKAYPNPVSGQELTIEFENTQHHSNMELRLYDAFGKETHRRRIYTGQQDTRLDVGHWPPGLYLAVIYSNGGAVGRCKVVVE